MYEPRDFELVFAVVLLAVVIGILGAPFAWNEYNHWIDQEKITRNFKNIISPTVQTNEQPEITPIVTSVRVVRTYVRPTVQRIYHKITDGFWCRETTKNIGKAPTEVRECYQFLSDGTFRWGYSPGYLMGKSPSCWAPNVECEYSILSNGRYEVQGGYIYTLSENILIDPMDPPYFLWSPSGIP